MAYNLEVYRSRAANVAEPASHRMLAARVIAPAAMNVHDPETALRLSAESGANYFADISEYQRPFDASYAYPVAMFRFFSGYRTDNNARANWTQQEAALSAGHGRLTLAYPVFVPGQINAMLASLKNVFGSTCPTKRLVVIPDMESGPGFAGPGNHSAEANDWVYALADYTNTPADLARAHGYANKSDFATNWPQIDPRVMKHTAAYNALNPGTFAWQYQGGNPSYPAPVGAPRSYAPFGTYVDGNVIYRTLDNIEQLLRITAAPPTIGDDTVTERIIALGSGYYRYADGLYMLPIPNAPGTDHPSDATYTLLFDNPACITKRPGLYGNPTDAVVNASIEVCDQAHFDIYAATIPKLGGTSVDVPALAAALAHALPDDLTPGATPAEVTAAIQAALAHVTATTTIGVTA